MGAFLALSHVNQRRRWEYGVCHSLVTSPYLEAASLGAPETGAGQDPRDTRAEAGQAKDRLPRAWLSQTNPSLEQASLLSGGQLPHP